MRDRKDSSWTTVRDGWLHSLPVLWWSATMIFLERGTGQDRRHVIAPSMHRQPPKSTGRTVRQQILQKKKMKEREGLRSMKPSSKVNWVVTLPKLIYPSACLKGGPRYERVDTSN